MTFFCCVSITQEHLYFTCWRLSFIVLLTLSRDGLFLGGSDFVCVYVSACLCGCARACTQVPGFLGNSVREILQREFTFNSVVCCGHHQPKIISLYNFSIEQSPLVLKENKIGEATLPNFKIGLYSYTHQDCVMSTKETKRSAERSREPRNRPA